MTLNLALLTFDLNLKPYNGLRIGMIDLSHYLSSALLIAFLSYRIIFLKPYNCHDRWCLLPRSFNCSTFCPLFKNVFANGSSIVYKINKKYKKCLDLLGLEPRLPRTVSVTTPRPTNAMLFLLIKHMCKEFLISVLFYRC